MTDTNPEYFLQLVVGLQGSAWMLLGKVANPMTGKIEKNLDGAKQTIDTLEMLKEKTKGNLNKQEEELLNQALSQLQINYIAEVENGSKEEEGKEHGSETKEGLKSEGSEKKT